MSSVTRSTLESGVPQLDHVLGGGIPEGDLLLIVGAPGSGKTTLACQVAFHAAHHGSNVLFVSTLSEPASRLVKHLRTLTFWDEAALGRRIFFESIFPVVRGGIEQLLDALVDSVQERDAKLIVLDGFASLRDLHPDSSERRTFVNQLAVAMAALDCTTIVTSSDVPDMRSASSPPEFTMCDSIVELSQNLTGERHRRSLRAWKVRGAKPLLGPHAFRITEAGLAVYPRLSALVVPEDRLNSQTRITWGTRELDAVSSGGLPSGSSTVVAGVSGTGKTALALQFLIRGAAAGERGVLVSFRESERQLIQKARAFSLDLETPLREGLITVLRRLPVDLEVDEVLNDVHLELTRRDVRRLAIDSIAELEQALTPENRRGSLAVFRELLRIANVTSMFVRAVAQVVGPELEFANSPLEVLADNVVLLRNVRHEAGLARIATILKMREAAHDASLRQYVLDSRGFHVLPLTESAPGLLKSLSHRPDEARRHEHLAAHEPVSE